MITWCTPFAQLCNVLIQRSSRIQNILALGARRHAHFILVFLHGIPHLGRRDCGNSVATTHLLNLPFHSPTAPSSVGEFTHEMEKEK